VTSIWRGLRTYIRENFPCEPGGCGARPGDPCTSYIPVPGKSTGNLTSDVHAARRAAYLAYLKGRPRREPADQAEYAIVTGAGYHSGQPGPGRIRFYGF
jgi:hypothetical protein